MSGKVRYAAAFLSAYVAGAVYGHGPGKWTILGVAVHALAFAVLTPPLKHWNGGAE